MYIIHIYVVCKHAEIWPWSSSLKVIHRPPNYLTEAIFGLFGDIFTHNEKNITATLLKFTGYIHNHKTFLGNIFGLIWKTRWPPRAFFRFQQGLLLGPSRSKGIIGRDLNFAGYVPHYKIFTANIFGLILKNKMAATGVFLTFSKDFCLPVRAKGIKGRDLIFAGYIPHYKILTGNIFYLILKNKMAAMGVSLSVMKSAYSSLIIGPRGLVCQASLWEIMGWESFYVIRFDLGPLLQGQTRRAKLKSVCNSPIIGPRGNGMVHQPIGHHGLGNFWSGQIWSWTLLQGQTKIAKPKSAYNSLIIGPRGLGW